MKRLAIISTHPIQYNVPWFRRLAAQEGIEACVFYTWHADENAKYDPDFKRPIAWDIPLLNGYDYELVAPRPTIEQKTFWNLNSDITGPIEAWGADAVLVMGWNYRSHLSAMRYFSRRIPVYFGATRHYSMRRMEFGGVCEKFFFATFIHTLILHSLLASITMTTFKNMA